MLRTGKFSQTPKWVCDLALFVEYTRPRAGQLCYYDFHRSRETLCANNDMRDQARHNNGRKLNGDTDLGDIGIFLPWDRAALPAMNEDEKFLDGWSCNYDFTVTPFPRDLVLEGTSWKTCSWKTWFCSNVSCGNHVRMVGPIGVASCACNWKADL